jgi:hypothetical protein
MPSLSLNIGLNNGRKLPFGGGAAPSGIPTATTTIIFVSTPFLGAGENFYKSSPDYWYGPEDFFVIFDNGEWKITYAGSTESLNTSANQTVNYIPQTNWSVPTTITVVA